MKGKGGAYSACSESNRKNAVNAGRPCGRIRYQYGDYFGVVNTSGSTGEHGETGMGPCWIWDHRNSDNGTKTACVMVRRRKLLLCIVSAVLYWLILFMLTALFFGGQYSGIGVTGMIIFSASAAVCMGELKNETRQKSGGYGKKRNIKRSIQ